MRAIAGARQADRPVIVMMGGHPIKLGLSRFLIDLIERRLVTHLATNGAGIIHDFELAVAGGTSEDVAKWIHAGQFGLWQETSRLNDMIVEAAERHEGLGLPEHRQCRHRPGGLSQGPRDGSQRRSTVRVTTAVFDLVDLPNTFRDGPPTKDHPLYYYRPWKTILCRTIADGGKSYYFQGASFRIHAGGVHRRQKP